MKRLIQYHLTLLLLIQLHMSLPHAMAQNNKTQLAITNAWIRKVPTISTHTAAYFQIKNTSNKNRILVNISSPIAAKIEIHTIEKKNGLSIMQHIDSILIPSHSKVTFKPGGYHIMVFNFDQQWFDQKTVPFTFQFDDGSSFVEHFIWQ